MKKILILNMVVIFLIIPLYSAAHYIVGIVEDAKDGTSSNDHTVLLWNPSVGIFENLTDIIGPNGNSHVNNIYMIDCELLPSGCNIGEDLTLKVINNGDNYISEEKNVTVNGFGYDIVGNITLNSPPNITNINVEDDLIFPENEIDLIPAETKEVQCVSIITEYDGEDSLNNASAVFFDNVYSHFNDLDDNNHHYTNNSCDIDYSYGNQYEAEITCLFNVWYYSNSEDWNCTIAIQDNLSIISKAGDITFINPLLALGVDSVINFDLFGGEEVTRENEVNVTNYGNVKINLSLSGYAFEENDGYAMNCTFEGETSNISIEYEKFNLTQSSQGALSLSEFESRYVNLTSSPQVKKFDLDYRKQDSQNEAINSTYWRIYVPSQVSGECQGNIIFGAVTAPGD